MNPEPARIFALFRRSSKTCGCRGRGRCHRGQPNGCGEAGALADALDGAHVRRWSRAIQQNKGCLKWQRGVILSRLPLLP